MFHDDPAAPGSLTTVLALALILTGAGLASIASPTTATDGDTELCDRPLDIMFVIDTSNSMKNELPNGQTRMEVARNGAVNLATQLSPDDTSGVVDFSREVTLQKGLDKNHDPTSDPASTAGTLNGLQIDQPNGETWTDRGIEEGHKELVDNGRAGVPNVLVLLTDGRPYPTWRTQPTLDAAQAAKDAGTEIFAIGVEAPSNIMEEIASDPDSSHFFDAKTSGDVLDAFDAIRQNLYQGQIQGESYAVRASLEAANGQVDVHRVNHQLLPPGEEGTIETVTVTTSNPPLEIVADVAHGATDGETTQRTALAHAITTIERLRIRDPSTSQTLLSLDTLRSESYSYASTGGAGSWDGRTAQAELVVQNIRRTVAVPPNTVQIPLAGYGTLYINEQIRTQQQHASSLRVNAIHLELDTGTSPGAGADVVIGSAFTGAACGERLPSIDDRPEEPVDVTEPDPGPVGLPCFASQYIYVCPQDQLPCDPADPTRACSIELPCMRAGVYVVCPEHLVDRGPFTDVHVDLDDVVDRGPTGGLSG